MRERASVARSAASRCYSRDAQCGEGSATESTTVIEKHKIRVTSGETRLATYDEHISQANITRRYELRMVGKSVVQLRLRRESGLGHHVRLVLSANQHVSRHRSGGRTPMFGPPRVRVGGWSDGR